MLGMADKRTRRRLLHKQSLKPAGATSVWALGWKLEADGTEELADRVSFRESLKLVSKEDLGAGADIRFFDQDNLLQKPRGPIVTLYDQQYLGESIMTQRCAQLNYVPLWGCHPRNVFRRDGSSERTPFLAKAAMRLARDPDRLFEGNVIIVDHRSETFKLNGWMAGDSTPDVVVGPAFFRRYGAVMSNEQRMKAQVPPAQP
jgi:hypothetical protein